MKLLSSRGWTVLWPLLQYNIPTYIFQVRFTRMIGIIFGNYITFTFIPSALLIFRLVKPNFFIVNIFSWIDFLPWLPGSVWGAFWAFCGLLVDLVILYIRKPPKKPSRRSQEVPQKEREGNRFMKKITNLKKMALE